MSEARLYRLRADWVISPGCSPLEKGEVLVRGKRILAVGPANCDLLARIEETSAVSRISPRSIVRYEYPGCALLPGLINAHTHLELSTWSGPGPAGIPLWEWIPQVIRFRRSSQYRAAEAIAKGLVECVRGGACGIVNIALPGEAAQWPAVRRVLSEHGLGTLRLRPRIVGLMECIDPKGDRDKELAEQFAEHCRACREAGVTPGLSPHAPYTVPLSTLERLVDLARRYRVLVAMHLAETEEEQTYLRRSEGPFRKLLADLGAFRPGVNPPGTGWPEYLHQLCRAPRLLLVHGNYLSQKEIELLRVHRERVGVVFCPRTHREFRHRPYPLEGLLARKIPVLLGTDSRASNPDLAILRELQTVRQLFPGVPAGRILAMASCDAARLLGWRTWGRLQPGASAQLTIVRLPDRGKGADPLEAVLSPDAAVEGVWIDGRPVLIGEVPGPDLS